MLFRAADLGERVAARVLDFQVQVWIYLMLVTRNIGREWILSVEPGPPQIAGLLDKVVRLAQRGQSGYEALARKSDRLSQEWKRWEPVIESGDIRQLRPLVKKRLFEVHGLASMLGVSRQRSAISRQQPEAES